MHGPAAKPTLDAFMVGQTTVAAFSLPQRERLRRSLPGVIEFRLHDTPEDACKGVYTLVVRDEWVIEKRILQALIAGESMLLKEELSGKPVYIAAYVPTEKSQDAITLLNEQPTKLPESLKSLQVVTSVEICGSFEGELRKRGAPVAAKLTEETRDQVERALFQSSYKGATDFITKYIWPEPALLVVRALARRGVTPNVVTLVGAACVIATFYSFWVGAFWWGIASAFMMAFLDTVDGKLARVTLAATRAGHLLDHGIDLISPPFWWGAWFAGLLGSSHASTEAFQNWGWTAFWIIMANYWLVRGVEALFVKTFRFNIHIWKPADFAFRLITTRRNVNVTILAGGLLLGRPDLGFIAVSVWSVASLIYHTLRFCQARLMVANGKPVQSYLS